MFKRTDMGPAQICRAHLGAVSFGVTGFQGRVAPEIFGAKFKMRSSCAEAFPSEGTNTKPAFGKFRVLCLST